MTKKFGDHEYDKFINNTLPHMGKYVIQEKTAPFKLTYPQSIKDARDLIGYNNKAYLPAASIGGYNPATKAVGVQARPTATPATKVFVPKGKAAPATKVATPQSSWPFPPGVAASTSYSVAYKGVTIHVPSDMKVEFNNWTVTISKK